MIKKLLINMGAITAANQVDKKDVKERAAEAVLKALENVANYENYDVTMDDTLLLSGKDNVSITLGISEGNTDVTFTDLPKAKDVIIVYVFQDAAKSEGLRQTRKKKVQRNPIVWRGKYVNVSRTTSGRYQPHFREISLGDRLEGEVIPFRVHAELNQAQKDLGINLEEGCGLNLSPTLC